MAYKELKDLETNEKDDLDYNQIRKLYHDATDDDRKQEWYFGQITPTEDPLLSQGDARLRPSNDNDDTWIVTGAWDKNDSTGKYGEGKGQVRLEAWSKSASKRWLNMEITTYVRHMEDIEGSNIDPASGMKYVFQLYGRGGSHRNSPPCDGGCYKIGIMRKPSSDVGKVAVRKEVYHPYYLNEKGIETGTTKDIFGRWIGLKQVLYNFKQGDRTCVANEIWIDDDSHDNGSLKISNNWRNVSCVNDTGSYGDGGGSDFKDDCPTLDKDETGDRRKEHIINKPGGASEGDKEGRNIASLRCDSIKLKIKFFSVREIKPPQPHGNAKVA